MESPFETLKEWFLLRFPEAGDIVFVAGKTSRVFFFMLVLFGFVGGRALLQRLFASADVRASLPNNQAYAVNQALVFFGTAIALWAPYAKVGSISTPLVEGVIICLLVQSLTILLLHGVSRSVHQAMLKEKSMSAGVTLGLYSIGAGIGTNAVLTAAL